MARLKQVGIDVDVHRAIEQARQSFSESENDILRRLLLGEKIKRSVLAERQTQRTDQSRARGLWSVEVSGERTPAANMRDAYKTLLLKLDGIKPDFLNDFAVERSRSRKFVARRATDLYASSPHLAGEHAHQLKEGWYFDTNLSTEQVAKRVRVAARIANMHYGRDIKILENMRVI